MHFLFQHTRSMPANKRDIFCVLFSCTWLHVPLVDGKSETLGLQGKFSIGRQLK